MAAAFLFYIVLGDMQNNNAQTGPPGPPGAVGTPGVKGEIGIAGSPGVKGETGDAGPIGPTGSPGKKGDTGLPGPKGDTTTLDGSVVTLKGDTGSPGPKGEAGPQGEAGAKGEAGDKGDTGRDGAKGDMGEVGRQGPKGNVGIPGPEGETMKGDTGSPGSKGDIGPAGSKGLKGDTGRDGLNGAKGDSGIKGEKGDIGLKGNDGVKGVKGSPGNSPFTELAHSNHVSSISASSSHSSYPPEHVIDADLSTKWMPASTSDLGTLYINFTSEWIIWRVEIRLWCFPECQPKAYRFGFSDGTSQTVDKTCPRDATCEGVRFATSSYSLPLIPRRTRYVQIQGIDWCLFSSGSYHHIHDINIFAT